MKRAVLILSAVLYSWVLPLRGQGHDPHAAQFMAAPKHDSETDADKALDLPRIAAPADSDPALLDKVVLGFYPGWRGSSYQQCDLGLYPYLSYHGYQIDPQTGQPNSLGHWQETQLVELAHQKGSQVELMAFLSGKENLDRFFAGPGRKRLPEELVGLVKEKDADGLSLDLHGIAPAHREPLTQLLRDLRKQLDEKVPFGHLTLCLPGLFDPEGYDFPTLLPLVDHVVLKAYGYSDPASGPAPIAPYPEVKKSIESALAQSIPRRKLLLGIANYGYHWSGPEGKPTSAAEWMDLARFRREYNHSFEWDRDTRSPRYAWNTNGLQHTIWMETDQSLSHKMDLVREYNLGGVAVWAMGYDRGFEEVNALIRNYFLGKKDTAPLAVTDSSRTVLLGDDGGATRARNRYNWIWMLVGCVGFLIILQILKRMMK